jgi:hypothetical protein
MAQTPVTKTYHEVQMPDFPPGYRGATQIPEWLLELINDKPNAGEAWQRLVGIAKDEEVGLSDAEVLEALYESTREPVLTSRIAPNTQ